MSRRGSPRCRNCQRPVVFFKNPMTGKYRPFNPTPVRDGQQVPGPTYTVENNRHAWQRDVLVEDLMVRLHCGRDEAEEHALAMPRYLPHTCPDQPREER